MRESKIEAELKRRVEALGGEVRKLKWIGRRSAPDRLVMLPEVFYFDGSIRDPRRVLVELKATGKGATPAQMREHERLRGFGWRVEVVNSFERIEEVLR